MIEVAEEPGPLEDARLDFAATHLGPWKQQTRPGRGAAAVADDQHILSLRLQTAWQIRKGQLRLHIHLRAGIGLSVDAQPPMVAGLNDKHVAGRAFAEEKHLHIPAQYIGWHVAI